MQIKLVQDESAWDALAQPWNQLLNKSHAKSPFQIFEFQRAWWTHKGGGEWPQGELFLLLGYSDKGDLEAIAPLFLNREEGQQTLRLIGSHEIADFLDVICPAEQLDDFLASLLCFLLREVADTWDALDLFNLLDTSKSPSILKSLAADKNLHYADSRLQASPLVTIPASYDAYLESLAGKDGQELRRKLRRAARYPVPINLEIVAGAEKLSPALDDFFALMNLVPEKAAFLQGAMQQQMQLIAEQALKNGWGHIAFLTLGEQRIAAYLNFDYDARIWAYNSGYDPAMSELSPGWLLTAKLIEWCIAEGKEVFDFMRGDEQYKYQFGGKDRFVLRNILTKR